jgi:hypothetical protein
MYTTRKLSSCTRSTRRKKLSQNVCNIVFEQKKKLLCSLFFVKTIAKIHFTEIFHDHFDSSFQTNSFICCTRLDHFFSFDPLTHTSRILF